LRTLIVKFNDCDEGNFVKLVRNCDGVASSGERVLLHAICYACDFAWLADELARRQGMAAHGTRRRGLVPGRRRLHRGRRMTLSPHMRAALAALAYGEMVAHGAIFVRLGGAKDEAVSVAKSTMLALAARGAVTLYERRKRHVAVRLTRVGRELAAAAIALEAELLAP
jgi:hypothetical protein